MDLGDAIHFEFSDAIIAISLQAGRQI